MKAQLRSAWLKVRRVAKNVPKDDARWLAVVKRLAKVDSPVCQQSWPLKKLQLRSLKSLVYQLPAELPPASCRRSLQQVVKQLPHWVAVKAAVKSLALWPAKAAVAASCPVRTQVKLLLVCWQKAQVAFDLQPWWPKLRLKCVVAVAPQCVLNYKKQPVANPTALSLPQWPHLRVA